MVELLDYVVPGCTYIRLVQDVLHFLEEASLHCNLFEIADIVWCHDAIVPCGKLPPI